MVAPSDRGGVPMKNDHRCYHPRELVPGDCKHRGDYEELGMASGGGLSRTWSALAFTELFDVAFFGLEIVLQRIMLLAAKHPEM